MSKKFSAFVCYGIAAVAILAAVVLTALSFLLKDLRNYAETSLDYLARETGYTLTLEDISFTLLPRAGVLIHNVRMHEAGRETPVCFSRRVHILTELAPLLRRHITISTIALDEPFVQLEHSDYLKLVDQLRTLGEPFQDSAPRHWFDFTYAIKQVLISDGAVRYHDEAAGLSVSAENLVARFERLRDTGTYDLLCSGRLDSLALHDSFSLQGPVRLHLSTIDVPGPDSDSFSADMDLSADDLRISARGKRLTLPPAVLTACVRGAARALHVPSFDLTLPGHAVLHGLADIDFTGASGPLLTIALHSDWFSLEPLLQEPLPAELLPAGWIGHTARLSGGDLQISKASWSGTLVNPSARDAESLKAVVLCKNVTYALDAAPDLLLSHGRFECEDGRILGVATFELLPGDTHIMHTTLSAFATAPRLDISLASTVPAEALNAILPADRPLTMTSGFITASTSLGYSDHLEVSSRIDLSRAGYRVADAAIKPPGMDNRVTVQCSAPGFELPRAYTLGISLADTASLSGLVRVDGEQLFEGSYRLQGFRLSELVLPGMRPAYAYRGRLSGEGSVSATGGTSPVWSAGGTVALDSFQLIDPSDNASLLDLDLQASFRDRSADIKRCAFRLGVTDCRFSGQLDDLLPPRGRLTAESNFLDIDDFVLSIQKIMRRRPRSKSTAPGKPSVFQQTHISAPLHIKKVNFLNWTTEDSTTSFSYIGGAMHWDNATLHAPGGYVLGSVLYDFSNMRRQRLVLTTRQSSVDFFWAVPGMAKTQTISGLLDIRGSFESFFRTNADIGPNMTGAFDIRLTEGKIQKFTVLSKILSMFSLASIIKLQTPDILSKGMPYELIDGSFTLKDTVMTTDDLVIKSSAMNLSAVGDLHIADEEIDFIVGAQPLETLGKIVGSVPFAGNLLTGDGKTLTVGYFRVQGPFSDTSVTPMPVKSISTGVRKVFSSLLGLPRDLLQLGFPRDNETATNGE